MLKMEKYSYQPQIWYPKTFLWKIKNIDKYGEEKDGINSECWWVNDYRFVTKEDLIYN